MKDKELTEEMATLSLYSSYSRIRLRIIRIRLISSGDIFLCVCVSERLCMCERWCGNGERVGGGRWVICLMKS